MSSEFSQLLMQASKLFSLVKNRIWLYGKRKIFPFLFIFSAPSGHSLCILDFARDSAAVVPKPGTVDALKPKVTPLPRPQPPQPR